MNQGGWSETTDKDEWDEFVSQNGGSVFHTWPWRKVLESRGSNPSYIIYRNRGGAILAACPFVYGGGRRFSHLEPLPNTPIAGPVVNTNEVDAEKILGTLPTAVRNSYRRPVIAMHICTHSQKIINSMKTFGFEYREDPYGLLITDLKESNPDHIWNNGFKKHDRQAVKYHENLGSAFWLSEGLRDYEDYLSLKYGPRWNPYGQREFFMSMVSDMAGSLKAALVTIEGKGVAALLLLLDPAISTVHLLSVRYSLVRNIHSPVIHANWKMVNWANENGFRYVDFGVWLAKNTADPSMHAYVMKRRFEASFFPRVKFSISPSGLTSKIARNISKAIQRERTGAD